MKKNDKYYNFILEQINIINEQEGLFGPENNSGGSDPINLTGGSNEAAGGPSDDVSSGGLELDGGENKENNNDDDSDSGDKKEMSSDIDEDDPNKSPEDNVFDYIKKINDEKNGNPVEILKATKARIQSNSKYNNPTVAKSVMKKMQDSGEMGMVDASKRFGLYLNAQEF